MTFDFFFSGERPRALWALLLSPSLRLFFLCLDKLEKAEQEKCKLVAEYEELDKRVKGIPKTYNSLLLLKKTNVEINVHEKHLHDTFVTRVKN